MIDFGEILFYVIISGVVIIAALIALAVALVPLLGAIFVLTFNIGIGREILDYEWDGAERLLWLAVVIFLFPLGAVVYIAARRPQRQAQYAALAKAGDPRVAHITPPKR